MIDRISTICLLLAVSTFPGGCSTDSDNDPQDMTSSDVCEVGACDAIGTTVITARVFEPDGSPHCGPATLIYTTPDTPAASGTVECTCPLMGGQTTCEIEGWGPDIGGKTTSLEVQAPNFGPGEASVDVPCVCHPNVEVDITLGAATIDG